MTNSQRQRYGLGSFVKKAFKKVKKLAKSPLGKAALIGLGGWGLNKFGIGSSGIGKNWWSKALGTGPGRFLMGGTKVGPGPATKGILGGAWDWAKANPGKAGLLGLGAAGVAAPFFAGKDEDEEDESPWDVTPSSIANIRNMARLQDPSLAFLPQSQYVQPGYYTGAKGGIVGLANGGQPAKAQAEQMLKMEYQKYRNQGGTMSYQQFKMAVLQQAQSQGPMAQGQPQRGGYQGGELVEDASMIEETPTGMMEENVEEVQGEPTREQMEALAMEIFQLRLEELDEEQLMIVYQAAMEQQPEEVAMQEEDIQFNPQMAAPQMAANGGRIGLQWGGPPGGGMGHVGRSVSEGGQFGSSYGPGRDYGPTGRDVMPGDTFTSPPRVNVREDDKINTAINTVDNLNRYKNFAGSGNIKELFKVNPLLLGGSFLYNKFRNRNKDDSAMVPGNEYDDIPNNLIADASLSSPYNFTQNQILTNAGYDPTEVAGWGNNEGLSLINTLQLNKGGRVGLANGGVPLSHVPGYTTPAGYNQFDYPSGGVRVRRAEGGIMDLGGMEKDYRQEGGFVPLGGEEKADDVPARLSKNEFVFTADAVRNAGGGDIDQGAEVMQNMMDNLEQGGQISEESQGGGGEEMISEEEIIEAPNGAQEMYDQQQMLQSRMV